MKQRRLNSKVDRPLSRRGAQVGKDGHFIGAIIGGVTAIASGIAGKVKGNKAAEEEERLEQENLMDQGFAMQNQQEIQDTQHSRAILSSYNPQGDSQMYAEKGAKMYTPYPYQDQPRTMINPTMMYQNGGKYSNLSKKDLQPLRDMDSTYRATQNPQFYNEEYYYDKKPHLDPMESFLRGMNSPGNTTGGDKIEHQKRLEKEFEDENGFSIEDYEAYRKDPRVVPKLKTIDFLMDENAKAKAAESRNKKGAPNKGNVADKIGYEMGGKTLLQMVQAGQPKAYWPTESPGNLNNPGNVSKHRDNMDQNYYGSSQDQYPSYQGGGTLLERVQAGNPSAYWPHRSNNSLNNPGNVMRHRDNMDRRYPGSSQNFQTGGGLKLTPEQEFLQKAGGPVEAQNYKKHEVDPNIDFTPDQPVGPGAGYQVGPLGSEEQDYLKRQHQMPDIMNAPNTLSTYGEVWDSIAGMDIPEQEKDKKYSEMRGYYGDRMSRLNKQYPGGSVPSKWTGTMEGYNPDEYKGGIQAKGYQGGGTMFDELQNMNVQEYQSYQQGGAAEVPGGEIEQVTERGQVVNGDNPGMIDDVELGTNPGEPQAMVDHNEVMVDSVDEQGQPFKQVFSDTVLVPGKNISMAKEAKKLLKQMPDDEESDQAKLIYSKLDELFNTQQMLNGDSEGENPAQAAAGGMDPNAAMEMGQEGQQAFQEGGKATASDMWDLVTSKEYWQPDFSATKEAIGQGVNQASRWGANTFMPGSTSDKQLQAETEMYDEDGFNIYGERRPDNFEREKILPNQYQQGGNAYYNEGMREQQMQVPYPRKNLQGGGWLSGIGNAIGQSAATEFGNGKGGANIGNILSSGMNSVQSGMKGYASGYGMGYNKDNPMAQMGYGMMGANTLMDQGFGAAQGIQNLQRNETGQVIPASEMNQEFQNGGEMYDDQGYLIMGFSPEPLPNTLADMQSFANPNGWGHMSEEGNRRRNSNLMGRMHRESHTDATPVISPSERGGPTPKKRKGYVMGGRLRYGSSLNTKSLTLSIQK